MHCLIRNQTNLNMHNQNTENACGMFDRPMLSTLGDIGSHLTIIYIFERRPNFLQAPPNPHKMLKVIIF